jgi:hypothetical protein
MENEINLNLEEQIEEFFQCYKILLQEGAYYRAVKRLAEIANCLPKLHKTPQMLWKDRLRKEPLPEDVTQIVKTEIEKDIQQVKRILSFGTKWTVEEIVLVLSNRIDVDLVSFFLKEYCFLNLTIELEDVDEAIIRVAKSKENNYNFRVAVSVLKKNWGFPIDNQWLSRP